VQRRYLRRSQVLQTVQAANIQPRVAQFWANGARFGQLS
jgi:hypothetical protein